MQKRREKFRLQKSHSDFRCQRHSQNPSLRLGAMTSNMNVWHYWDDWDPFDFEDDLEEYICELERESYDQTPEQVVETRKSRQPQKSTTKIVPLKHDRSWSPSRIDLVHRPAVVPDKAVLHEQAKVLRKARRNLRSNHCRGRTMRSEKKDNRRLVEV